MYVDGERSSSFHLIKIYKTFRVNMKLKSMKKNTYLKNIFTISFHLIMGNNCNAKNSVGYSDTDRCAKSIFVRIIYSRSDSTFFQETSSSLKDPVARYISLIIITTSFFRMRASSLSGVARQHVFRIAYTLEIVATTQEESTTTRKR